MVGMTWRQFLCINAFNPLPETILHEMQHITQGTNKTDYVILLKIGASSMKWQDLLSIKVNIRILEVYLMGIPSFVHRGVKTGICFTLTCHLVPASLSKMWPYKVVSESDVQSQLH